MTVAEAIHHYDPGERDGATYITAITERGWTAVPRGTSAWLIDSPLLCDLPLGTSADPCD